MLNDDEVRIYKNIFFDYGITAKNNIENYEWKNLAKFIINWRTENVPRDDPLLDFWFKNVAPSCVYHQETSKCDEAFVCVFCKKEFRRSPYLIRHYKENHYEKMPDKIFGEKVIFKCEDCNLEFVRKDYLTVHLNSEKHLKTIDPDGVVIRKRSSKFEEIKQESDAWNFKKIINNEKPGNFRPLIVFMLK